MVSSQQNPTNWVRAVREVTSSAHSVWRDFSRDIKTAPKFWELALDIDEPTLGRAVAGIVERIQHKRTADPIEICTLLFFILRTRLTNVSGSYLWPEVAREISGFAGRNITASECGAFFRKVIEKAHPVHLATIKRHNRFVILSLEEAGVGKNRREIVLQFLQSLLDESSKIGDVSELYVKLDDFINGYLKTTSNRDDVEALLWVLRHSGMVLLRLAKEIRSGGVAFESAFWDWDRLREYWLLKSGDDLYRVCPEAQEIFGQLIGRLGETVTRQAVVQMVTERHIHVRFPDSVSNVIFNDPGAIPLGPATLAHSDFSKDVQVCDDSGLRVEKVIRYKPSTWHRTAYRNLFCWMPHPFEVKLNSYVKNSVSMYSGPDIGKAVYVGDFWSGSLERGIIPSVNNVENLQVEPILQTFHYWTFGESGLVMTLRGFRTFFLDYKGKASLHLNTQKVWSGQFANGRPLENFRLKLSADRLSVSCDSLELFLCDEYGVPLSLELLSHPVSRDNFICVNGLIRTEEGVIWIKKDDLSAKFPKGVYFFHRSGIAAPSINGGSFMQQSISQELPQFHASQVISNDTDSGTIRITAGDSWWEFRYGKRLELDQCSPSSVSAQALEVDGMNGLIPVLENDPMEFLLKGWNRDLGVPETAGDAMLALRMERDQYRKPLQEIMKVFGNSFQHGVPIKLSLLAISKYFQFPLSFGIIHIELQGQSCGSGCHIAFYRLPSSIEVLPCRIGESSEVAVIADGIELLKIISDRPVRLPDVLETKRITGSGYIEDEMLLSMSWQPKVEDARLISGEIDISSIATLDLCVLRTATYLQLIGSDPPIWRIIVDTYEYLIGANTQVLLKPLIESVINEHEIVSIPIQAFVGELLVRQWDLDLSPTDIRTEFEWIACPEGGNSLSAELSWFGLPTQALELQVISHGVLVSLAQKTPCIPDKMPVERTYRTVFNLFPTTLIAAREDVDIYFNIMLNDSLVKSIPLPCFQAAEQPPAPNMIRNDIMGICERLSALQDNGQQFFEQLLYLTEMYLRQKKGMPFPADVMGLKLGSNTNFLYREATGYGLNTLEILSSDSQYAVQDYTPSFLLGGKMRLFVLTLSALQEVRLAKRGLARPSMLRELSGEYNFGGFMFAEGSLSSWAKIMSGFCLYHAATMLKEPVPLINFSDNDIEQCLSQPLIAFDRVIIEWLEHIKNKNKN